MVSSNMLFQKVLVVLCFTVGFASSAILYVSKDGRGEYPSVQMAIEKAKSGDEIIILDYAVYEEQVTIDSSLNRLILRSENPKMRMKPTIKYQDKVNVGPRTYAESQDQSKINFDRNGAARVIHAQGVTIEGIIFDGGGPAPYGYEAIWEQRFPLFSGNAALTLTVAGDIVVRHCEFKNAFYGIYIKDRNEGGIYANANPADLQPQLVVPLSGFGKTGNHLIEQNRIHNNSWGLFIESAWDLGSTIRYNLFYQNDVSEELATEIDKLPGSTNQWGAAITFKDLLLTPMAIYNNTFHQNSLILCADWQVGGPALIFNNIYGKPIKWKNQGMSQSLDVALPNRMFHCLYASQDDSAKSRSQEYCEGMQDPETNQYVKGCMTYKGVGNLNVMYSLPALKPEVQTFNVEIPLSSGPVVRPVNVDWGILQGAVIASATANTAFPKESYNRWYEPKFQSTDPLDPNFLVPDWEDSTTKALIVDQGWPAIGIRDADGTIADIGAIPFGAIPETEIMMKPVDPVLINGTTATTKFVLYSLHGEMKNPKIKYIKWVRNIKYVKDGWGSEGAKKIPQADIIDVNVPATPLVFGSNTLNLTIPKMDSAYGFFDITIEGTDAKGVAITSNVGFLPYRAIDYIFDVLVKDASGTTLTSVKAGDPVQLWITPKRLDGKPFEAKVEKISIVLSSNFDLLNPAGAKLIPPVGIQGLSKSDVMFTKIPASGTDQIKVSGMFTNPKDTAIFYPIFGSSSEITILPGPPEKVAFQDPHSNGVKSVDPGMPTPVTVQVFDKYDNKINTSTKVGMVSTAENIGKIVVSPVETDLKGLATFIAQVVKGNKNDTFPVVATLLTNNATDHAKLVVGKPRDRFWVFYSDVGAYDPLKKINACSGTRVPIAVWASKDGVTPEATHTGVVVIELSAGMKAFASENPEDTVVITEVTLAKGAVTVWVKAVAKNVANGSVSVYSKDGSVVSASRENINFAPCNTAIKKAAYFSDNGYGAVDRAEIYFEKPILKTEIPDSMRFAWPAPGVESKMVPKSSIIVDSNDSSHITVRFAPPFAAAITKATGSTAQLGTYYWWNPLTPDAPSQTFTFAVADSVGPLLMSALVVERLSAGSDSLYLSFSESVIAEVVKGSSLTLIKNGVKIPLTVENALPQSMLTIVAIVKDLGENSIAGGDSLMITPNGPVVDAAGNHAHPINRSVVITIRQVPADISGASYFDMNADGTIDRVVMQFNKKVDVAQMSVRLIWGDDTASRSLAAADMAVIDGDAARTVQAIVPLGLFSKAKFEGQTSGAMAVRVVFTAFTTGNIKSEAVADSAAPVLKQVTYSFGAAISSTITEPDTVTFSLSEPGTVTLADVEPLQFVAPSGAYPVIFSSLKASIGGFTGIVKKPLNAAEQQLPSYRDSAFITTVRLVVADTRGNIQKNPLNRKVPVTLNLPPFMPEILVGPNPFAAQGNEICHIVVKSKSGLALIDSIRVTLVIYDKVGNKVKTYKDVAHPTKVDIVWNGTNERGRYSGNGTYLGMISCVFIINGQEVRSLPERIHLAVH